MKVFVHMRPLDISGSAELKDMTLGQNVSGGGLRVDEKRKMLITVSWETSNVFYNINRKVWTSDMNQAEVKLLIVVTLKRLTAQNWS